ncbi:MAG: hypothetical protein Q9182_004947 [Xanthomendoza sp. 2 TL-2023]
MRKDKDGTMAKFFRDEKALTADIIAVQERWINRSTRGPSRCSITVRHYKRPLAGGQDPLSPKVVQALRVMTVGYQVSSQVAIHNAYLVPPTSQADGVPTALETMSQIERVLEQFSNHEQVLLGDFNAWHPDWNGPNSHKITGMAMRLKAVTERYGMELNMEPGTITRPADHHGESGSTIDLTWSSQQAAEQLCSSVKRAKRRWQSSGDDGDRQVWKQADAEKKRILQRALTDDYRERVLQCDTVQQLEAVQVGQE